MKDGGKRGRKEGQRVEVKEREERIRRIGDRGTTEDVSTHSGNYTQAVEEVAVLTIPRWSQC